MRFKRIYIEIINICNLNCDFCVPHTRKYEYMSMENFIHILDEIKNYSEYIYLHVKGEPLLHPQFDEFVKIAYDKGFKINLTTNATLLKEHLDITKYLRQINVSFHATNNAESLDFTRFSALFFVCLCFRIDDELRLFFAHVLRVHITITLN